MSDNGTGAVIEQTAIVTMADAYSLTPEAFERTFRNIAMPDGCNDAEFVSCCLVAQQHGLNPLTKEIYFMKTKSGAIQPIVGVDGWIKKCNEHPQFDGMSFEDHFDGKELTSVTCTIHRKDRSHPTSVTEYLKECRTNSGPWKTHPCRFLRHRALMQCARIAFGFAGVVDRDEFDQWQGMKDITPAAPTLDEIPDVSDTPETSPVPDMPEDDQTQTESDDLIADPDGLVEKIREGVILANGDADVIAEVREQYEHLTPRLPKSSQAEVARIYEGGL